MFEDMPPAGWYVLVVVLVVCLGLMAFSYMSAQEQRTAIYSEACSSCQEKLELCISMIPDYSPEGVILDLNSNV